MFPLRPMLLACVRNGGDFGEIALPFEVFE
jgi:hypothetical protein